MDSQQVWSAFDQAVEFYLDTVKRIPADWLGRVGPGRLVRSRPGWPHQPITAHH